ncbi:MAG TPA: molybdenum cofactor guanylyltransferase [Terriglobia bacterium]|nr:molybdenum cofactor guanylyltransferase [Terriglobia bacterium]
MRKRILHLTGFVLAGGSSRRMGRAKAGLILQGQTMLARQARLLGRVAGRVAVVGFHPEDDKDLEVPMIPDELPGRGPLGGIYTGLLQTGTEYNLFLGCDMPFVNRRLLRCVAQRAFETGADATVAESSDGRLQTLCAVYRRRARWAVRASLAAGDNKLRSFFSKVDCEIIPWRDLARAGFLPSMFDNMNAPADYESARKRLEPSPGTTA